MALEVKKVDIWAGDIPDKIGGLSHALAALANAGANLECVIARRQPEKPGTGVVFVTPIKGRKAQVTAGKWGMIPARDIATLRVEGPDKPGLGGRITAAVAEAGVNVRGISAASLGNKFVCYIGFDNAANADKAAKIIRKLNGTAKRK